MQQFGSDDPVATTAGDRSVKRAMTHGALGRCPSCGKGRLFASYLRPVEACAVCAEDMHHQRADDFPPYLAILIVGHIVLGGFMATDQLVQLESWQHLMIWVPITIILCLALLQPLKGGVIGLQWACRMHGFSGEDDETGLARRLESEVL